jgi:hypothetical protein
LDFHDFLFLPSLNPGKPNDKPSIAMNLCRHRALLILALASGPIAARADAALPSLQWAPGQPGMVAIGATPRMVAGGRKTVSDSDRRGYLAPPHLAADPGRIYLAYIPRGNAERELRLTALKNGRYRARWIDPREGRSFRISQAPRGLEEWRIPDRPSPSSEDWVVIVEPD